MHSSSSFLYRYFAGCFGRFSVATALHFGPQQSTFAYCCTKASQSVVQHSWRRIRFFACAYIYISCGVWSPFVDSLTMVMLESRANPIWHRFRDTNFCVIIFHDEYALPGVCCCCCCNLLIVVRTADENCLHTKVQMFRSAGLRKWNICLISGISFFPAFFSVASFQLRPLPVSHMSPAHVKVWYTVFIILEWQWCWWRCWCALATTIPWPSTHRTQYFSFQILILKF